MAAVVRMLALNRAVWESGGAGGMEKDPGEIDWKAGYFQRLSGRKGGGGAAGTGVVVFRGCLVPRGRAARGGCKKREQP